MLIKLVLAVFLMELLLSDAQAQVRPSADQLRGTENLRVEQSSLITDETLSQIFFKPNSPKTLGALKFLLEKPGVVAEKFTAARSDQGKLSIDPEVLLYDQINSSKNDPIPDILARTLRHVENGKMLATEASKVLGKELRPEDLLDIQKLTDQERLLIADWPGRLNRRITRFLVEEGELASVAISDADKKITLAQMESVRLDAAIAQAKAESAQADTSIAQAKAESAQAKAESAQAKAESAQAKAESARLKAQIASYRFLLDILGRTVSKDDKGKAP